MNSVLESVRYVVRNSQHVTIDYDQTRKFAKSLSNTQFKHWLDDSPTSIHSLSGEEKAAFLFVFNSISFSYWGEPKWRIKRGSDRGTLNMIASIERARQEGVPILNSKFLAELNNLEYILRGEGEIPLIEERQRFLKEVGQVISLRYGGSFLSFIEKSDEDAQNISDRVIGEFPSFYDSAQYKGREILFHKRAQLLAADIAKVFGLGGTEQLTACADYILPLVLHYKGILKYAPDLDFRISKKQDIPKNSEEEVEIRASTIEAVELIKKELKEKVSSMQINDYLWLAGNNIPETEQYHLTRTTAY